ncbi:MAG TPA: fused MFS/spermidine synthase [Bryobacteraceae bacterium]|nr:fused MFS/spermidine synthase [Bryobacteraceae bacterium]
MPVLLFLFAGSGCAALIYEVVWFQLLQLVIGSSAVSLGVLLGTYMGGMCIGSLLLSRVISRGEHPLRVYGLLELGIGFFGVAVLFVIPMLNGIYTAAVGDGLPSILLRGLVAGICLLPPTILMGASLPAIGRWVESTPLGVSWLGLFYGGNIAGAVFGCLFAGFYLLRVHDMRVATYIAAAINIGVAMASFVLRSRAAYEAPKEDVAEKVSRPQGAWPIYTAIALSGLCALGAEVVWTRLLALMLGATVYTFSIILAVFLIGLGIGSSAGSVWTRRLKRPRLALGASQLALAFAVAWTAYAVSDLIPSWPFNPLAVTNPWRLFRVDFMMCLMAILPPALLWGLSFPLALAAVANREQDSGALVGEVYAANTVGAILGAVGFSIVLIPWVGTQGSQQALIALSILAGLILFYKSGLKGSGYFGVAAATLIAIFLFATVSEVPWLAIAYGRRMSLQTAPGKPLYIGEGRNSSVVVSELDGGQIYFHVSGKVEASTEPYDMRLQRMLGHIPALIHKGPESVLVVGFGAGVTAGTFVVHPEVKNITICEIEPLIPQASSKYFASENHDVFHDPRTRMVYDDARHFVLTTKDKFDIITSDPIHPWVKGTATLYSKEYFELVKKHLNPGGVITQWVPLYESDFDTVKSELATFFDVFPNGTIWGNDINGEGYDVVLLAQVEPTKIDIDALDKRMARDDYKLVRRSLAEVNFHSVPQLLGTYAGRASDLKSWLQGAQVNEDMNLRLQYLAGMGLNYDKPGFVYSEMLSRRTPAPEIFSGSAENVTKFLGSLGQP